MAADLFYSVGPQWGPRGEVARKTLAAIEKLIPPDATMVTMPEGVMLNYLTRRRNPTPYINFMPVELAIFGEDEILRSLEDTRPDYVVLVHKRTEEYGYPLFGADPNFGKRTLDWVYREYAPVGLIGFAPLQKEENFGVRIMRRK